MQSYSISSVADTGQSLTSTGSMNIDTKGFLQLLVAQLKSQNPFSSSDNGNDGFLGQVAQLSTLEQMQQLNTSLVALVEMNAMAQASTLIGKCVETLPDSSGATIEGVVSEVSLSQYGPILLIDGRYVLLSEVATIREAETDAQ